MTYVGIASAFAGISFAVSENIPAAMICLVISGICDLFDGVIARRCKRDELGKRFGVQIDSLADSVSFVALPSVLGLRVMSGFYKYPVILAYILCGVIRLAWFNASAAPEGGRGYFDGLPVTYSALIFSVFWTVTGFFSFDFSVVWAVLYAVIAMLFILNVRIPKPRGVWYGIFGALAVAVAALIMFKYLI